MSTTEAGEDRQGVVCLPAGGEGKHDEHAVTHEEGTHEGGDVASDLGELPSALDGSPYASCARLLFFVLVYDNMCILSQCGDYGGRGRSSRCTSSLGSRGREA